LKFSRSALIAPLAINSSSHEPTTDGREPFPPTSLI